MSSIYYHFTWWGSFFAVVFVFQVILNSAFTFSHPGPAELFQIWEKKSSFDLIWTYKQLSHLQVVFPKSNLGYFLQKLGWDKSHPSPSVPPGLTPKQEPEKMELSAPKHHITVFNLDTKLIEINQNPGHLLSFHCTVVPSYEFATENFEFCSPIKSQYSCACSKLSWTLPHFFKHIHENWKLGIRIIL